MPTTKVVSLAERPDLRTQVIDLIARDFPRGAPCNPPITPDAEFPLLLATANAHRNFAVIDPVAPNLVLATASYYVHKFATLRCAAVGLVVTDVHHRARGYSRKLLLHIETNAQNEGAALCVLWSDQLDFYTNLGYLPAGAEKQWEYSGSAFAELKHRVSPSHIFDIKPLPSFSQTDGLYQNLGVGPERQDLEFLLRLPNTVALGAYQNGILLAYAIMGKARDLRDTLHELVGDSLTFAPLIRALMERVTTTFRVHQPATAKTIPEVENILGRAPVSPLAFFKIVHAAKLADWLKTDGHLAEGMQIHVEDSHIEIKQNEVTCFATDDAGHLLQIFFGPWAVSELTDLPPTLVSALRTQKFVPLYFWGFDSV